MRYTFGHTLTAAERLQRLAEFFNPLASDFICSNLNKEISGAADLGCGPGYTTEMLANATQCKEVTGIDISDYFIGLARKQFPKYTFINDDVTSLEPSRKYDLLYCRFLLSHLNDIPGVLMNWMNVLKTGGLLFIDEFESINTGVPVFKRYLEVNTSLIRSQGAELYIGEHLDKYINGFKVKINQSDILPVEDSMAAGWFYPNTVSVWNKERFIKESVTEKEQKAISDKLLDIHNSQEKVSNIAWKMKRIVLTK